MQISAEYTENHLLTYLELLRIVNDAVSSSANRFLTTAVDSSESSLENVSTRAVFAGAGLLSSVLTGSGNGVVLKLCIACL